MPAVAPLVFARHRERCPGLSQEQIPPLRWHLHRKGQQRHLCVPLRCRVLGTHFARVARGDGESIIPRDRPY